MKKKLLHLLLLSTLFIALLVYITNVLTNSDKSYMKDVSQINQATTEKGLNNLIKSDTDETELEFITAEENTRVYVFTDNGASSYSTVVPLSASFNVSSDEILNIKTINGLEIMLCTTCQTFVPECGDSREPCILEEVIFDNNITLFKHFKEESPENVLGYNGVSENSKGHRVGFRVVTQDFRELTNNDKNIVLGIIQNLK